MSKEIEITQEMMKAFYDADISVREWESGVTIYTLPVDEYTAIEIYKTMKEKEPSPWKSFDFFCFDDMEDVSFLMRGPDMPKGVVYIIYDKFDELYSIMDSNTSTFLRRIDRDQDYTKLEWMEIPD